MAYYARIYYPADGDGDTSFQVPFQYIREEHVLVLSKLTTDAEFSEVLVKGTDYNWTSASTFSLTAPRASDVDILVERRTPADKLLAKAQAGVFSSENINLANLQSLFLEQEALDAAVAAQALFDRSVKAPLGEMVDLTLPPAAQRAGKTILFSGVGAMGVVDPQFGGKTFNAYGPWDPTAPFISGGALPDFVRSETLSLAKFGFVDSGTLNQSGRWEELASYCATYHPDGVVIDWGSLKTVIDRPIYFATSVHLRGAQYTCSKLLCRDDGALKLYGLRTPYASTSYTIGNVWIATEGRHPDFPLSVEYQDGFLLPDASLSPTVQLHDMLISGKDFSSGYLGGLDLLNVPWPRINNVAFIGDQQDKTSGFGVRYRGGHGSLVASGLRCFFVENGLDIFGSMEGIVVEGQSEFVAVRNGISYGDSTSGLQPYCAISNTHVNAEKRCIGLQGIDQFVIGQGCSLYGQNFDGTDTQWTAIEIAPSTSLGSIVAAGSIADCMIVGEGQALGKLKYGIHILDGAGFEDYLIDNNRFQGCDVGVRLEGNVNGVQIPDTNSSRNTVVPVQNLGTGQNYIQGLGYRYPFARLPDPANFTGGRLFVLDSSVTTFGAPAAGGGSGQIPVYSDGTQWRVG